MNRVDFVVALAIALAAMPWPISAAHQPASIADKIEPITPRISAQQQLQQQQQQQQQQQDALANRSPFLDSLFNIPIQTLRAVSDLVQGIAGSVQGAVAAGAQRYPLPPRKQPQRKEFE